MTISRRGFLKGLGGIALAAVAAPQLIKQASAPLFIPADRLDFGVPKPLLVLPDAKELAPGAIKALADRTEAATAAIRPVGTIPMTMLQTTFSPTHGGRLWAGSTVLVDEKTAGRWVDYGIAAPEQGYHVEPDTTRRVLEAAQMQQAQKIVPKRDLDFSAGGYWRNATNLDRDAIRRRLDQVHDRVEAMAPDELRERLRALADEPQGTHWKFTG